MKPIRFSAHAREQMPFRGATEDEAISAIRNGKWEPAELDRLSASMDFPFEKLWNKRYYRSKRVRLVFVEEGAEIVVITVYVYYMSKAD